jgi:hypothetical protein
VVGNTLAAGYYQHAIFVGESEFEGANQRWLPARRWIPALRIAARPARRRGRGPETPNDSSAHCRALSPHSGSLSGFTQPTRARPLEGHSARFYGRSTLALSPDGQWSFCSVLRRSGLRGRRRPNAARGCFRFSDQPARPDFCFLKAGRPRPSLARPCQKIVCSSVLARS